MSTDPIGVVKRELLVRQLDSWTPAALHRSRRATFAQAYAGGDGGAADAALRVFVEFADLLRGRRTTALTLGRGDDQDLAARHAAVQSELPAGLTAHLMPGGVDRLPVALKAAAANGAPVFAYLDGTGGPEPAAEVLAAVAGGRPAELLLVLDPPVWSGAEPGTHGGPEPATGAPTVSSGYRRRLTEAGLPLVTEVELVAEDRAEVLVFATAAGKRLDAFKNALWAVDEYAGVRYRDPGDPEGHLLDISLNPHPGPLRRELLARLATVGAASVTELRQFTAERTVYRPADTNRVLTALLAAGLVSREPEAGRLAGDVTITGTPAS
ncbi:hypothetical protein GCM10022225_12180 [Plantactinospora mayteni]|uniref:Uncharacterized protein n=1 Tax=Plantactinospora mayteni TaxID=566021 RepID=A0ABQ4EH23_9ACTN|nr:hypothetical protein [Plantactinospora mayteni]GIG94029.1 hypothetical protein Pma05_06020 [Plantactinospora mayteni]